jgi:anti-anti-sigma factor
VNVELKINGNVATLNLSGRFDLYNAKNIGPDFLAAIKNPIVKKIELNFRNVTSIDSTGLARLVECKNACADLGLEMVVCELSDLVRKILEISGILDFME